MQKNRDVGAHRCAPEAAAHILIHGRVQGVGYRYFVEDQAQTLSLVGWVRNLPQGDVEAYAEGSRNDLEQWIEQLRKGPPLSRVEKLSVDWPPPENRHSSFSIEVT